MSQLDSVQSKLHTYTFEVIKIYKYAVYNQRLSKEVSIFIVKGNSVFRLSQAAVHASEICAYLNLWLSENLDQSTPLKVTARYD